MKYTKRFATAILMLMLVLALAVPTFAKSKAKKPKLSQKKVTLETGGKVTLTLKNAKASKVKWSSTNKKVATVKKGKVTAKWKNTKKSKTCYIKAKYKGKTYKCKVTVKAYKKSTLVNMWGNTVKDEKTLKVLNDLQNNFGDSNGKIKPSYVNSAKASAPIQVNYGGAKVEYPFGSDYRIAFPKAFKGLPGGYIELSQGWGDDCSICLRKSSEPNGYYSMPIKKVTCSYPNFVTYSNDAERNAISRRSESGEPLVFFEYDYGWGYSFWISWYVPEGTVFTVSIETVNGITADYTVKVVKTPININS